MCSACRQCSIPQKPTWTKPPACSINLFPKSGFNLREVGCHSEPAAAGEESLREMSRSARHDMSPLQQGGAQRHGFKPCHHFTSRFAARLRVLRIFFVAAQAWGRFSVDIVIPASEHELQSPPRALPKRWTLTT